MLWHVFEKLINFIIYLYCVRNFERSEWHDMRTYTHKKNKCCDMYSWEVFFCLSIFIIIKHDKILVKSYLLLLKNNLSIIEDKQKVISRKIFVCMYVLLWLFFIQNTKKKVELKLMKHKWFNEWMFVPFSLLYSIFLNNLLKYVY